MFWTLPADREDMRWRLAKKGFQVTGVDLSPFRSKRPWTWPERRFDVEWVREDMSRFVRPEAFDLVINIFRHSDFDDNGTTLRS